MGTGHGSTWTEPWDVDVDPRVGSPVWQVFSRWFDGGMTNICYNAVDRHAETMGGETALIFEGNDGEEGRLTCVQTRMRPHARAQELMRTGI